MSVVRRNPLLLICLTIAMLLSACAGRPTTPAKIPELTLPMQLHVQKLQHGERQDALLVIQEEGDSLRFSLFDPMGAPIARQRFEAGSWERDGVLPPNPEARELFAALLFSLTDESELSDVYPDDDWRVADNLRTLYLGAKPRWQASYGESDEFDLRIAGDAHYHVVPVDAPEAPQP